MDGESSKRATIADIARIAGLTKGTVSHALNDRAGVSAETRARVKAIAAGLGWLPNPVTRALSGARAGAVGWVIRRSAKSNTIDPYFMEFFAGIEVERSNQNFTMPIGLQTFFQQNLTDWGPVMACAVVMMAPPVIVFAVLHRFFSVGGIGGALAGR